MKKIFSLVLGITLLASLAFAEQKLVDLPLSSTSALVDSKGNLTAGGLIRNSDATYVNTAGALAYSRGTRTNLVLYSDDLSNAWWEKESVSVSGTSGLIANASAGNHGVHRGGLLSLGTSYIMQAKVKAGVKNYAAIFISAWGAGWANTWSAIYGINTTTGANDITYNGANYLSSAPDGSGFCTISFSFMVPLGTDISSALRVGVFVYNTSSTFTDSVSNGADISFYVKNIQLEALPSGNVIGSDLMDQEVLGGTELFTNPSFTSNTTNWDATNGTIASVAGGQSGNCLELTRTGADTQYASQELTITPGTIVKFSVWVKSGTSGNEATKIKMLDGAPGYLTAYDSGIITTSGTWTQYSLYGITRAATTIFILQKDTATAGTMLFDTASVQVVSAPAKGSFHGTAMLAGSTELVTNGGMETDANWSNYNSPTTNERSTEQKYLGTYSRKWVGNAADDGIISDTFTTVAGKLYKCTTQVYISALTATSIRSRAFETTGYGSLGLGATTTTTGSWQSIAFYFVATNTTSAIVFYQAGAGDSTSYIDYVSVRQVQTAWTRTGTNTLEIDESVGTGGKLKVTYVDSSSGANLDLLASSDMSSNTVVGETYQVSLSAIASNSDGVSIVIYDGTAWSTKVAAVATSATTYTCYFKSTNATGCVLQLATASGRWGAIDDLTIKSVPDLAYLSPGTYTATAGSTATIPAEPRFETNGLLVEGEATNLLPYSSFGTGWLPISATAVANAVGLDGVANSAYTFTSTSAGAYNAMSGALPLGQLASGVVHTLSVYVKEGTSPVIQLNLWDTTASANRISVSFQWTAGVLAVKSNVAGTGAVRDMGGGWYRASATSTTGIVGGNLNEVKLSPIEYGVGGNGKTVIYYGAQLEATAYPTSYIPTNGCPVTRLTEAGSATNGYSWTMSTALKNSLGAASPSRGTMLFDVIEAGFPNNQGIIGIRDDTNNRGIYQTTDGRLWSIDGGGSTVQISALSVNTQYTIALRWESTVAAPTTGALKISKKSAETWTHGTAGNYDGNLNPQNSLRLAYGNEYPFWIRNVKFYDYWIPDSLLDVGGFGAKGGMQHGMSMSLH